MHQTLYLQDIVDSVIGSVDSIIYLVEYSYKLGISQANLHDG